MTSVAATFTNSNNVTLSLPLIANALGGEVTGTSVKAPGPAHSPTDRSLSVKLSDTADGGFMVFSHAGDDGIKCKDYVRDKLGLPRWKPRIVKNNETNVEYVYRDEHDKPVIKILRRYKNGRKDFPQFRWENEKWAIGTKGITRVPYNLPQLIAEPTRMIYFVEGEKDADRLISAGLLSTTASQGSGAKWQPELTKWFVGRDIVVIPDNDEPGRAHADKVARALVPVARSVRIVTLPGLPDKGDVSDWLDQGGEVADLITICETAPLWAANDNVRSPDFLTQPNNFLAGIITEDAVALRFAELSAEKLRYCHGTGAWFEWNEIVWRKNETQLAFHWARVLARELSEKIFEDDKVKIRKASFASSVEKFCRADPTFAVTLEHWDRDHFKLGTPGGTVDLKTGRLSAASRADGITKLTAVAPAESPDCPLWLKFLQETTGNDLELMRYLQLWCGYCLTGDIREHALVFVYGGGGNGKSVFLNTVGSILFDYAVTAAMDTFTASRDSKHPTDLAMLRGARLVTASETEEGKPFAEAKIKQMTGGDKISARFMRQDFFTFLPQFKLTIVGNYKPTLQNVDEALRRRFNIIPFTRKPDNPDRELGSKLRAEAPAILRWMIDGCLDWQANGLVQPESIITATNEYFEEQDLFGHWLEECCDVDRDNHYKWENATELFKSWQTMRRQVARSADE